MSVGFRGMGAKSFTLLMRAYRDSSLFIDIFIYRERFIWWCKFIHMFIYYALTALCIAFPVQLCMVWLDFLEWRRARSRPCDGKTAGGATLAPSESSRSSISNLQRALMSLIRQGQFGIHSGCHLAGRLWAWNARYLVGEASGSRQWLTWLWRVLETLWSVTVGLKTCVVSHVLLSFLWCYCYWAITYAFSFFSSSELYLGTFSFMTFNSFKIYADAYNGRNNGT